VSSSAQQPTGMNRQNNKPYAVPRPLESEEMPTIYEMHRAAARNAMAAGFDGVEVHMGHGYLVDSFFDTRINDRTDRYGGSVENRCRFAVELATAVLAELGPEKVMVRISPSRDMGGIYDWPEMEAMIAHLIPAFDRIGLRMLDVSSARADYTQTSGRALRQVRTLWKHTLIGGSSLTMAQAEAELREGIVDMVTWGRHILANPDVVSRSRAGGELKPFDVAMLKALV
jgi:N-ethylmaleimide reductase